ncbi:MAG: hypothetical protein COU33_02800 [Candidatus Magasanikbacteria bacterium CG10_big_fil_rev_8_21_14_0_10_43_6]|uniref:DUF1622 domain-containing protein n=1 Tax=Candidatus Magasanikbacteria bacterium CG10_big_fil_rev_8_21_14_0_10_43_6 TaxID=1974650 RepID=A0A2M6W122_9BACT|nr:MAG: hypothetical protein COU33_02800 [Candidatus Magasanikbacteria bacterium CG10_big_fil_rev_8_21_14_0_10_43_6]
MEFIDFFASIVRYVGLLIEYIGLVIVAGSACIALFKLPMKSYTLEHVRRHLAKRIILGLEFIIAADILLATVATSMNEILQLGGIVLIRLVLGYMLRKEAGLK